MIVTAVVMLFLGYHLPGRADSKAWTARVRRATPSLDNIARRLQLRPERLDGLLHELPDGVLRLRAARVRGRHRLRDQESSCRVLPKAVNEIIVRVLIFYVGALVAIMCIVPWTTSTRTRTAPSPPRSSWCSNTLGSNWAAALVFFVVITAASSALNSLLYSAGRHLYQLAQGRRIARC